MLTNKKIQTKSAFTIVELLITVVVIAILAAITIVSYSGITNQAKEATLKADLNQASTQLALLQMNDGVYPATFSPKQSGTNSLQYVGGGASFCITARTSDSPSKVFHITQDNSIKDGDCPETPPVTDGTMQDFTASACQSLPIYTGANTSAVRRLSDARDGTLRVYDIAKLPDNTCWMLTNLKLGSSSEDITLTSSNTDINGDFTLPRINNSTGGDANVAQVRGPVPGDTGSGETNYGYLYNWPAATAGATRTTHPGGSTAEYSICPAGWGLPTGGPGVSDFSQLDIAFGGTGNQSYNNPRWQAFHRLVAGYHSHSEFISQGVTGEYWSRSAQNSNSRYSYVLLIDYYAPDETYAIEARTLNLRENSISVRCILR